MGILRVLVGVCVVALAAWSAGAQTSVSLRSSIPLDAARDVTVGDVAACEGADSEAVGAIVIAKQAEVAATGSVTIDVERLRSTLKAGGVNLGKVSLRGGTCRVFVAEQAPEPKAPTPATAAPTHDVVDVTRDTTVRGAIATKLADLFLVLPEDLRLKFRAEDEALLSVSTAGRRVDVQTGASKSASRLPIRVFVYSGGKVVASGMLTVDAMVRRQVYTATTPIERGDTVTAEAVSASMQWIEPNAKVPAAGDRIIGSVAKNKIAAGAMFLAADVEPPLAARRGDLIWVHCLSGSVNVKAKARVMADAREGETVTLRLEGVTNKRTFTATMSGPGLAVLDLDQTNETATN